MINKLVSINNVLLNLMDDLGLDHGKYRPTFTNWALMAERNIGGVAGYKRKWAVLKIDKCSAEIPCDAKVLEMALMGNHGCDCQDLFKNYYCNIPTTNAVWDNGFLIIDKPTNDNYAGYVNYVVQNNYLVFDKNYDGQDITIQYLGVEVDENGIPLVGINHLEAIAEYCKYKYWERNIRNSNDLGRKRDHKYEWERLCARARGEDAEPTEAERRFIVDKINDPLAGRGLVLGTWKL